MKNDLTNETRYDIGKLQMEFYLSNQYPLWNTVAVSSIRKMILEADDFYADFFDGIKYPDSTDADIHKQIRIGWLYAAMSHGVQAVEDLFSLLKTSADISYFARNVVNYNASEVKKYIWNFDCESIPYILEQFHLPYFSLDDAEAWGEHRDVFEFYKSSVLLTQSYIRDLIEFYKKYYLDYCQYKHGMAVALCPFGKQREEKPDDPLEGVLMTFDSYHIGRRMKDGMPPELNLWMTPETAPDILEIR